MFFEEPINIPDGTRLQYLPGSMNYLTKDIQNVTHSWLCFCETPLPLEYGDELYLYNKPKFLKRNVFVARTKKGEMEVRLTVHRRNGPYDNPLIP